MTPGANLSHAARMAFDARRALIAVALHVEACGLDVDVADLLEGVSDLAAALQQLADDYGHAVAARAMAASQGDRRAA